MKRYMVLLVGLLLACCQQNEVGKLEGNDPGQIECLTEELKELLSKNIEFKEGKIICHLNEEDALGEGVSRSAYQYLMKYLQEEQQRIDQYLEEGAIVFINGIPYTNNEALYQYVDTVRGINTRAETATLIHRQKLTSDMVNSYCDFLGPAEIMLGATEGSVCLREYQKNFVAYLNSMGVGKVAQNSDGGLGIMLFGIGG